MDKKQSGQSKRLTNNEIHFLMDYHKQKYGVSFLDRNDTDELYLKFFLKANSKKIYKNENNENEKYGKFLSNNCVTNSKTLINNINIYHSNNVELLLECIKESQSLEKNENFVKNENDNITIGTSLAKLSIFIRKEEEVILNDIIKNNTILKKEFDEIILRHFKLLADKMQTEILQYKINPYFNHKVSKIFWQLSFSESNNISAIINHIQDYLKNDANLQDAAIPFFIPNHESGGHQEYVIFCKDKNENIDIVTMSSFFTSYINYNDKKNKIYVIPLIKHKLRPLAPQADINSCGVFMLAYIKTLCKDNNKLLKESLSVKVLVEGGNDNLLFIPHPQILKYSQSGTYNEQLFEYVCNLEFDKIKDAKKVLSLKDLDKNEFTQWKNNWIEEYMLLEEFRKNYNPKSKESKWKEKYLDDYNNIDSVFNRKDLLGEKLQPAKCIIAKKQIQYRNLMNNARSIRNVDPSEKNLEVIKNVKPTNDINPEIKDKIIHTLSTTMQYYNVKIEKAMEVIRMSQSTQEWNCKKEKQNEIINTRRLLNKKLEINEDNLPFLFENTFQILNANNGLYTGRLGEDVQMTGMNLSRLANQDETILFEIVKKAGEKAGEKEVFQK